MTGSQPSQRTFKAALVQLCSGRSVERNVAAAEVCIRDAARQGAQYIQTPEITTLMEPDRARLFAAIGPEEGNVALARFCALAKDLGVWLHIGSMGVLVAADKIANRSYLIASNGMVAAKFDKLHMFDVQLPNGERYRESANYAPGSEAVLADLPWGRLGLTVCYDLRFPGLYRALAQAGAEVLAIPSAFTQPTGEAHWHVLMRARAIENGAFVLAAAQSGAHETGRRTYGHSLIVGPWGDVLADGGVETGVVTADINLDDVKSARQRVPSLTHDRVFTVAPVRTVAQLR
jgi:deaminated glutathione amidase